MRNRISVLTSAALLTALAGGPALAEKQAVLDEHGVYHVPAFAIPPSDLASEEYRRWLIERGKAESSARAEGKPRPALDLSTTEAILKVRASADAARKKVAERMRTIFPVVVKPEMIGGIQTDVVTPKDGVSAQNRDRVLINLHGGGMMFGARWEGQVISIPIASVGRIRVVTVDYRMAPEHRFPAASEDVAKVYKALLTEYKAENIGIYGHSAGASLTAQSLAWFQTHDLPRPGAIGLDGFGAGATGGDSYYLAGAFLFGIPSYPRDPTDTMNQLGLYSKDADPKSPLVAPVYHPSVLAKFPPTLVTNATRDPTMSGALYTHRQLVKAGVEAELHIWEGVPHSYHYDASLPESRDFYQTVVKFFDRHLGK